MDYDFNLIEIGESEDGGYNVVATDFVKKYWGPGAIGEVARAAKDPRVVPIMKENFSEKGVALLRKELGSVLVELITARLKKVPFDYNLIKVTEVDGHVDVDTEDFLDAYAKGDDLRIPRDVQTRIEALMREPFTDVVVGKIKKFLGDAFIAALTAPGMKYAIHSTVRGRHNRMERAQAPIHARFKQHVLPDQRRLIRNRPVLISEAELKQHLGELLEQFKLNILEVRTEDGRLVDLEAMARATEKVEDKRPDIAGIDWALDAPPVENHIPNRIPDSVANDVPTGIPFPRIPGDKVLTKDQIAQVVGGMASIEGELKVDPKSGDVTVVTEPPAPEALEEPELPHDPADAEEIPVEPDAEAVEEEEEVEDLPPGIPPPPPPPGGQPRPSNTNKKKHRR
jgi:hypothetical protein